MSLSSSPPGRGIRRHTPRRARYTEGGEGKSIRLLLVEDDADLAAAIRRGLSGKGFAVDVAHRGQEGEELALTKPYDLVILDLLLPDLDGVTLCRNLRRRRAHMPVLMLSALSATTDKVAGLEAGADDYLTKPFEFQELLARVRALVRRGQAGEATRLEYAGVVLDLLSQQAVRDGVPLHLRPKELSLLAFLMRNADRVLDRTTIAQKVWDISYESASNVIEVYISSLRKKLDHGFDPPLIHTVVGAGYRFGLPEARSTNED